MGSCKVVRPDVPSDSKPRPTHRVLFWVSVWWLLLIGIKGVAPMIYIWAYTLQHGAVLSEQSLRCQLGKYWCQDEILWWCGSQLGNFWYKNTKAFYAVSTPIPVVWLEGAGKTLQAEKHHFEYLHVGCCIRFFVFNVKMEWSHKNVYLTHLESEHYIFATCQEAPMCSCTLQVAASVPVLIFVSLLSWHTWLGGGKSHFVDVSGQQSGKEKTYIPDPLPHWLVAVWLWIGP